MNRWVTERLIHWKNDAVETGENKRVELAWNTDILKTMLIIDNFAKMEIKLFQYISIIIGFRKLLKLKLYL